jgi:L-aspartate oxidase
MRAVVSGAAGGDVIGGRPVDLPDVPTVDPAAGTASELRDRLQRAMTRGAGVLRDSHSLTETGGVVAATIAATDGLPAGPEREELRNLATVGWALLRAAEVREESRGCHTREDFPDRDPAFQLRLVLR